MAAQAEPTARADNAAAALSVGIFGMRAESFQLEVEVLRELALMNSRNGALVRDIVEKRVLARVRATDQRYYI
ncbi:MAG: hypothetical protein IKQ17_10420 [Kiritimatiellae bacterium]|nr:hypothetical protein [Kiritimatiellia bacterium]